METIVERERASLIKLLKLQENSMKCKEYNPNYSSNEMKNETLTPFNDIAKIP